MAIQSKLELKKYQFGIHVNQMRHLYGKNDKVIYRGKWLQERTDECIIVEMITDVGKHEAYFYQELNGHEHIIRTFGSIDNTLNRIIYVQEYAKYNDLHSYLLSTPVSQVVLIQMFLQIADAMKFIASKSMVHGDLGCRNILVFEFNKEEPKKNSVKVTDFGLARSLKISTGFRNSSIIPKRYCALEILRSNGRSNYTDKSDVYSMGVLMWEALSNGEIPYSYIDSDDLVVRAKLAKEKLTQPHICDTPLWSLIQACWDDDPECRPNFQSIVDSLSIIRPCEVQPDQQSNSKYEPPNGYDFKLDVDVTRNGTIGDKFRKIYAAEFIRKTKEPIVLIEMTEQPTDDEVSFFKVTNNHRHLINIFGFVENNVGSIMILQERAPHGHLQKLLSNKEFEPSSMVLVAIFLQIVDAMIYILRKGMIHGNLCCSNVLVFQMDAARPKQNFIKLTDFSSARPEDNRLLPNKTSFTVPVKYCAPEILRSAGRLYFSQLSEVYSMGVLMWEACSGGKQPYDNSTPKEIRRQKLNGEILCRPWNCDRQIWPIMKRCWFNAPKDRCDFNSLKMQLSTINPDQEYKYQLLVDVKMKNQLYGERGRIVYDAEWTSKKKSDILLIVLSTKTAKREASFYVELSDHRHIVDTFGLIKNDPQSIMLIQERNLHGNLLSQIKNPDFKPSNKVLVEIFSQIINAMIYMVERNIIHGDLRCANVLVFQMNSNDVEKNFVKLTNFALTCTNDPSFQNDGYTSITLRYAAPEIIEREGRSNYSEFSDVYSMGVLMWEVCSHGKIPYGTDTTDVDIRQKKLDGEKLSMPDKSDIQLWKIMEDCWYREPELRFNFNDMLKRLSAVKFPDVNEIIPGDNNNNKKRRIVQEPTAEIPPKRESRSSQRVHPEPRIMRREVKYQPPITSEPTLSIQCKYCDRSFTWDKIDDHERLCMQISRAPPHLLTQRKKSNIWERFCSCLPCFHSKQ